MAPCSHGRWASLCFDLRKDDLLGGPQPHSRALQRHVIFGLWGEKDDGSNLQATTYMFSAAVGAGGHLLKPSKRESRPALAWLLGGARCGKQTETLERHGNWLYHSFSAILQWANKQSTAINHLDLRARVADHIERHAGDYEPAWTADGKPGPDGAALQDWAKQHKVGAIYFHDKHFDFLKPDEAKYPKEIASVVTDSNGGFLVGGISEACSDSPPSSFHRGISLAATSVLGTSRPAKTRLRGKTCVTASAKGAGISAACTESTAAAGTARTPAASVCTVVSGTALASTDVDMSVRGPGQKRKLFCVDGYARCRLCPWRRACSDDVTAACLQVAHFRAMHPGETPAGNQVVKDMICQLPDGRSWWRCPLCEQGIPFQIGREACQRRVAAEIRAHKTAAHSKAVDCIMEAANAGRRTLVLGDWNLTQEQEEGEIAAMRRIDYGVALGDLFASSVEQCPEMLTTSLSDHLAVGYGFDLAAPAALRAPPRRRTYLQERPAQDTEKAFHDLLEAQDLDGAWALASDVAENLLFEPASSRKVLRRSAEWQPVAPRSRPIAKRPNWMVLVVFAPYGVCCRSSSCATCGLLPYLQCGTTEAVAAVSGLVDTLTKSERDVHLERWRQRTAVDESVVRSYVKRRADEMLAWEQAPPDAAQVEDGWHPAEAVCEQAQLWAAKWQRHFNPDLSMIDGVLAEVPRPAAQTLVFEVTAEALRESMQVMKSKTGGADGWMPRDLLLLPMAWYRWAAALWCGGQELDACSANSDLGSKVGVIMVMLVECLTVKFDMSVQSALMQVQQAFRRRATHFLQMDVSAYFDTINHITLRRTLEHLRFPSDLLELLCSFYTRPQRIFSMSGVLSDRWTDVTTGIPQGCRDVPWGPVQGQVSGIAYIDDRSLWLHEKCDLEETDCLEILGVRACFDEDWTLLRYQARKAILRARLLGWVTQHGNLLARLLASLVVPPFAWAAGFARPSLDDLREIRGEIVAVFSKSFAAGFAAVCLYEALGWQLHPDVACDLGTLRVLWKACVLSPRWLDYVPLSEAKFLWQQMIPEAPALLGKLRWSMQPDGSELSRRDTAGRLRVVRPGFDGFSVVFKWLRQHYRQSLVACTGRVKRSYHRDEAGLATGLDLPKPDFSLDYHFDGLHEALKLGLRGIDLAALGAGNSCWFYNAGGGYEVRGAAPATLDPGGFFEDLVEEIRVQLELRYTAALGNNDEDQTAYKQELLGFCMAAKALCAAASATGWTGRAVFVFDYQSALQVVLQEGLRFNYLLKLVEQVRLPLRDLASAGAQLQYVWVPSHGKSSTTWSTKLLLTVAKGGEGKVVVWSGGSVGARGHRGLCFVRSCRLLKVALVWSALVALKRLRVAALLLAALLPLLLLLLADDF
ncbi:hypothetical protein AK812_SmicGene40597 [Symbiodinium microadriaticum]|uniref:Uncharacterized protein n=1 Tax=Symbiodinium microadriaticum TaxID=2951 RepID=A0A1Q9C895_SYMMI|nr:hypothetical protein AK812_SmicGene40597 [Symbiodinium microadriaticum]CAE7270798.1 unnamed protein product [Symbiodinium microadriaticum]